MATPKGRILGDAWRLENDRGAEVTHPVGWDVDLRYAAIVGLNVGLGNRIERCLGHVWAGAVRRPRSLLAPKSPIREPIVAFAVHPCPPASSVQSIIVRAVTPDHAEGLQYHVLPTDDPLRALNILREAAGLPPLSDDHDDKDG